MRISGSGPELIAAFVEDTRDFGEDAPPYAYELVQVAVSVSRAADARTPDVRNEAIAEANALSRAALAKFAPDAPIPRPMPGERDLGPILGFSERFRDEMPLVSRMIRSCLLTVRAVDVGVPVPAIDDTAQLLDTLDRIRQHNLVPKAELGGFSIDEYDRMIADDWQGDGPIRLHPEVVGWDRSDIEWLRITDRLLRWFDERDPVPVPQGVIMSDELLARVAEDVVPTELGGREDLDFKVQMTAFILRLSYDLEFVKRRKGKLGLTPLGRRMLRPESTPHLFETLFVAHFQGLDEVALDGLEQEERSLNHAMGWVLHRVQEATRRWQGLGPLMKAAWPASMRDPLRADESPALQRAAQETIFVWRVLMPLAMFGLIEVGGTKAPRFRATPLFHEFFTVRRDISPPGPGLQLM